MPDEINGYMVLLVGPEGRVLFHAYYERLDEARANLAPRANALAFIVPCIDKHAPYWPEDLDPRTHEVIDKLKQANGMIPDAAYAAMRYLLDVILRCRTTPDGPFVGLLNSSLPHGGPETTGDALRGTQRDGGSRTH